MSSEDELGSIGTVFPGSPIDKSIGSILPQFDEEVETLLEDSFTWNIPDWNELTNPKYNSPRFRIGDYYSLRETIIKVLRYIWNLIRKKN